MLTILTFSGLLFLLVSAFYLNFTKRKFRYKTSLHGPVKVVLTLIYSINLTGFIIAGYLILNNEVEIIKDTWITHFIGILIVLILTTPIIYFSQAISYSLKLSITRVRLIILILNFYPLIYVIKFYNQ